MLSEFVGELEGRVRATIQQHGLLKDGASVLLMVSGGSDSTALAYIAEHLRAQGCIGACGIVHVNHCLRGKAAEVDAVFVARLAELLGMSFTSVSVDVGKLARESHKNVEAVGREQRYLVAHQALKALCLREGAPVSEGRIFTAHTLDDRIENFYMRSIVGTGPGGFRAMRYENAAVVRPLLDLTKDELRRYLEARAKGEKPMLRDDTGQLWREDATNAHTDRFRSFVRAEIVPKARERNPQLSETLGRTMNLIADEDDMLSSMAAELVERTVVWERADGTNAAGDADAVGDTIATDERACLISCHIAPEFSDEPIPLQRRAVAQVLARMLPPELRLESASIETVLKAAESKGGFVANIQGNLAVSANKRGIRIEAMESFRARRKKK